MALVPPTAQDAMKKKAAETAVERYVKNGMVVGLGTGSTSAFAIKRIGELVAGGWNIVGIPTSNASDELARKVGIRISTLEEHPVVDVTIDGADEVDPALNLIKGMGGALLREKIVALSTKSEIIIADETKIVSKLGTKSPLPVEVVQYGAERTRGLLQALGCEAVFRRREGTLYVSDNHNYIVDCRFKTIDDARGLDLRLRSITGVVENGLFLGLTHAVIVAGTNGVRVIERPS